MRQIDEHAALLHAPHQLAARVGEAALLDAVRRAAELVVEEVRQPDHAEAGAEQRRRDWRGRPRARARPRCRAARRARRLARGAARDQRVELRARRTGTALRCERARTSCEALGLELRRAPSGPRDAIGESCARPSSVSRSRPSLSLRSMLSPSGTLVAAVKNCSADAAVLQARQVDVPDPAAREQIAPGEQRVGVQVDDEAGIVQRRAPPDLRQRHRLDRLMKRRRPADAEARRRRGGRRWLRATLPPVGPVTTSSRRAGWRPRGALSLGSEGSRQAVAVDPPGRSTFARAEMRAELASAAGSQRSRSS